MVRVMVLVRVGSRVSSNKGPAVRFGIRVRVRVWLHRFEGWVYLLELHGLHALLRRGL